MQVIHKLNDLLDRRQKGKISILIGMMTIGTLFETISLSMLIPVVTLFISPTALADYEWLLSFFSLLGIEDVSESISSVIMVLIGLYLIKGMYQILQEFTINTFIANNQCKTMKRLFATYMQKPYEYYLYADSATIIRIITTDVNQMYALLLALLQMCSEIIMVAGLFCVLLLTDAGVALTGIGIIGLVLLLSKFSLRKILNQAGRKEQETGAKAIQYIQQAILAMKEIKISKSEYFFWDKYSESAKKNMQARRTGNLLSSVVKPLIETIGIILVFLYLLYAAENAVSLSSMLPKLLLFVTVMVRSMPLINSINSRQNIIAYYEPFLMQMEYDAAMEKSLRRKEQGADQLREEPLRADGRTEDNTIEMKDVIYQYPQTQKVILNHINLTIPSGSCVGIVGPSGSGKSTLVDILLGLLQPETGKVFWNQRELSLVYSEFLDRTAYIPQMVMMLDDTIRRNIAFGIEDDRIDEEQLLRAVEEAQLQAFIDEQPNGLDTVIGERGIRISGGQRQRIGIARALYRSPQILIFDEATSALDHDTEKAIIQAIQSLRTGRTIIMIAHRLNTLEGCDVVYRVENGHVEAVHQ